MQIKIFKNLKQYTITSAIKKDDIEFVKKCCPRILKKKDEEGNDIFAMSYVEGKSCIAPHSITFGATDVDSGCVMVVGTIPDEVAERGESADYVADMLGGVLDFVREMEPAVTARANEIRAERASLISTMIEV